MKTYARYKNSGISWIGEIPEHWDVKRVASFFNENKSVNKELVYKRAYQFKCGSLVPKNEIGDEKEYEETYVKYTVLNKNDLVNLNYDFVSQRVAICPAKGIITSAYIAVTPRDDVNPMYYCWLFKTMDNKKMLHGMGTGIRLTLSFAELKTQLIPVPPIEEQKSIVAYLDKKTEQINNLIVAKQKQIELLKEYKQSLIANAVTKGINPKAKMKDSGINWIGQIPAHWEIKRIASFFDENKSVNKDFLYKHAFQFKYGSLVPKNETGEEKEYEETYVKYTILNKDDIVFNGLNLNYDFISQRVAICPEKGIITSAYIAVTPRNTVDPVFYCWLFKTMDNKKMFHGMGSGIRLTLSFAELKSQLIPFPPIDEQKQIVAFINERVASIDTQISSIEKQIENLNEYKQSLISDVVTGKVKV